MLIERFTSLSGIDHAVKGCQDLKKGNYYLAGKNFTEGALRGTLCVTTALAIIVATTIINTKTSAGTVFDLNSKNPVYEVKTFCGSNVGYYEKGFPKEQCLSDVLNRVNSDQTFKRIVSDPYQTAENVRGFCDGMGVSRLEPQKCWDLISKNIQVLDRIVPQMG